jgi:cell division protein FtsI (penicillin-binding protein 3)
MFMEEVSLSGTAKGYFGEDVCSFRTGSKTGTAQVNTEINKVRYRKSDNHYYGSMVTYLPADKPRYTIMTAIFTKKQSGKSYYGASLAGPVQKSVATFLYNRDCDESEIAMRTKHQATDIKGGDIKTMRKVANEYGKVASTESREGWGVCRAADNKGIHIAQIDVENSVVPNVVGMGLNDAIYLLEKSGLSVEVVGCGTVVGQSIAPNTIVADGEKRIKIELQ